MLSPGAGRNSIRLSMLGARRSVTPTAITGNREAWAPSVPSQGLGGQGTDAPISSDRPFRARACAVP